MPSLDQRGIIAAAQLAAYVPVAVITCVLTFRHAFRRDAGWLFLFIFALARIAGGALILAAELIPNPNIDLFISAYILQWAGLAPLMLSTLGFLGLAGRSTYSENPRIMIILRTFGGLLLVALGLTIAGGLLGTHVSPDHGNIGLLLRRIGTGVFGCIYVLLFLLHIGCWTYRHYLRSYRRRLLLGITAALPFLGARVAYAFLSAWSASDLFGAEPSSNPTLARFNPVTGDWFLYLILSLIMEFIVAVLYLLSSTVFSRRRH